MTDTAQFKDLKQCTAGEDYTHRSMEHNIKDRDRSTQVQSIDP